MAPEENPGSLALAPAAPFSFTGVANPCGVSSPFSAVVDDDETGSGGGGGDALPLTPPPTPGVPPVASSLASWNAAGEVLVPAAEVRIGEH